MRLNRHGWPNTTAILPAGVYRNESKIGGTEFNENRPSTAYANQFDYLSPPSRERFVCCLEEIGWTSVGPWSSPPCQDFFARFKLTVHRRDWIWLIGFPAPDNPLAWCWSIVCGNCFLGRGFPAFWTTSVRKSSCRPICSCWIGWPRSIDSGWDIKHVVKLIVMLQTSSRIVPVASGFERDRSA